MPVKIKHLVECTGCSKFLDYGCFPILESWVVPTKYLRFLHFLILMITQKLRSFHDEEVDGGEREKGCSFKIFSPNKEGVVTLARSKYKRWLRSRNTYWWYNSKQQSHAYAPAKITKLRSPVTVKSYCRRNLELLPPKLFLRSKRWGLITTSSYYRGLLITFLLPEWPGSIWTSHESYNLIFPPSNLFPNL